MSIVFWISLLVIGYTYAGYPLVLRLLIPFRERIRSGKATWTRWGLARLKRFEILILLGDQLQAVGVDIAGVVDSDFDTV